MSKKEFRVVPHDGERMETGPIQFGSGDWPGVFIRGDNAFAYAYYVNDAAEQTDNPIVAAYLRNLARLLESCNVSGSDEEGEGQGLHWLTQRQGNLLTGVVNAIRGEPPELTHWSWHDAPDLARELREAADAMYETLKDYQGDTERHAAVARYEKLRSGWQKGE